MSNAARAFGTTLARNGNTIAEINNIGGLDLKMDTIDVTTHDSTSGFREFLGGLIDAGEVSIEGNLYPGDSNGQVYLLTDMTNRTAQAFVITFPAAMATTWTFTALVTAFKTGAPHDGAVSFSATLKVTGVPTLGITAVTGMSAIGFSNDVLMMPAFAIGVYRYVVTITAGQTSTVITPVDASDGEIITIYTDGGSAQVVASGAASSPCTLDVDDTTVITVVISHATKTSKTYTFNLAVLAA